jgi:myo-inositol 2-dehydrogenase / D-chiro-inositol 1-dehydrogenase
MNRVGVGVVGSQFISGIHFESLRTVADAEVRAVASPTADHVRTFAEPALVLRLPGDVRLA